MRLFGLPDKQLSGSYILKSRSRGMEASQLRRCANIRSKKHQETSCNAVATFGDFCSRHYKNPTRFQSPIRNSLKDKVFTRKDNQAIKRIQTFWRRLIPLRRFKNQGPCVNTPSLAQNTTEVYSLEAIDTIPKPFFFSFADNQKNLWAFDIRSLNHLVSGGMTSEIQNPYTRETLTTEILLRIHARFTWLRSRKYPILHTVGENLTQEQLWNQKVLDVFFKMEHLGYRASCLWFDRLTIGNHESFYRKLHHLWFVQLGLTTQEKEAIVPGYGSGSTKLFKNNPDKVSGGAHDLKWWRRNNLNIILEVLTRAPQKNQQSLGALYILMVLVQILPEVRQAYPWIFETVSGY